jgi:hypothetical protein
MGGSPGDGFLPGSRPPEPLCAQLVVVDITADGIGPGPGAAVAREPGRERGQRPTDAPEPGFGLADVVQQRRRDPDGVGIRPKRTEDRPGGRHRFGAIGGPEALPARELLGTKVLPDEGDVGAVERPCAQRAGEPCRQMADPGNPSTYR